MVRLDPGRRTRSQPDERALFQVGQQALLDQPGLAKVWLLMGWGRLKLLRLHDRLRLTDSLAASRRPGGRREGACALLADPTLAARDDATVQTRSINRQWTPAHLRVNPESTA